MQMILLQPRYAKLVPENLGADNPARQGEMMLKRSIGMLVFLFAMSAQAQGLVLEAQVMEASSDVELPGLGSKRVRYVVLHHKHQKDQASLAAWLQHHAGARVSFETLDGAAHEAVLERLKHCFGRGLLLYTDSVRLKEKDVIRLRLEGRN
jgi:hypothetical protein